MGKLQIGGELESIAQGNIVTRSKYIYDETKGEMQSVINQETNAELVRIDEAKQNNLTFDQTPTEESANPVTSGGVYAADAALQQAIEAILLLIPSAASALNQLADKSFVNSSVSTATATFRGTYNLVTDLGLTVSATHQQIATALVSVVSTADNNDYCFVQIPVSDQSSDIRVTERYKFDGTAWSYEYDLNNSGFTADQWAAINSGITSALVGKLGALPTVEELAVLFNGKQNVLTFDNVPTAGSNNPVKSGGLYEVFAVINAMIPTGADANNKLVAENRLVAYVTSVIEALDASYNITTGDGHVTLRLTQVNGAITSLQIATDDIASATALTALGERVSMNERDIDNLQAAYEALTQSDIVVVNGALPSSGQQQNIIYRQPDQDHTPPQFYSDYMWNGTTWVLMATYNNAIDPRPKKGSQNLVTSGGVFDNMGALDVSELNATENPHTLATYANLSAAIAAIPSDYKKGGMSIKYVRTSDNKYAQFRCIADSFSIDIFDWVIDSEERYIENEDYIDVKTDSQFRVLWAIKKNGKIFYGAGIPDQIIEYLENALTIDGKTILEYLNDVYGKYIENEEYADVLVDSDYKILECRKVDGTKLFTTPIEINNKYEEIGRIYIDEFLEAISDLDGKLLEGIKEDGTKVFGGNVEIYGSLNLKEPNVDAIAARGYRLCNPIMETFDHINRESTVIEEIRPFGNIPYQRCGTCVVTPAGTIIACTPIRAGLRDDDEAYVAISRIVNGVPGEPVTLFGDTDIVYGNPSFVIDKEGVDAQDRIYLFVMKYTAGTDFIYSTTEQCDCLYKYSDDDGVTWSEAVSIKSAWDLTKYIASGPAPANGIQLEDGTFVIPAMTNVNHKWHSAIIYKKNGGNWTFSIPTPNVGDNESTVYSENGKNIILNCRIDKHTRNQYMYEDGGNWREMFFPFDPLVNCEASIIRTNIYGYRVYLMSFPDASNSGDYKKVPGVDERARDRTTVWASVDGVRWIRVYRLKENVGTNNGYSVISENNGVIAVYYESNFVTGSGCSIQDISSLKDLIYDTISTQLGLNTEDKVQELINKYLNV